MRSFKSFVAEAKKKKMKKAGGYSPAFAGFLGKKDCKDLLDPTKLPPPIVSEAMALTKPNQAKWKHGVVHNSEELHQHLTHPMTGDLTNHDAQHAQNLDNDLRRHYNFRQSDSEPPWAANPDEAQKGEEKRAIHQYTRSSEALNGHLVHGHELSVYSTWGGGAEENLSRGLQRYQTPHDLHVFTGIKFHPEKIKKEDLSADGHMKIHLPAYTSTSHNIATASGFAGSDKADQWNMPVAEHEKHMLVLHVPPGAHGAHVAHLSNFPEENEFLLHKNAKIHVHPTPQKIAHREKIIDWDHPGGAMDAETGKYHTKEAAAGHFYLWHGHMVHDGIKPVSDKYEGD